MAKEYRWADLATEAEKDGSILGKTVALLCRLQQAKPGGAAVVHRDEDHSHDKREEPLHKREDHAPVANAQHDRKAEGTAKK